jgi:hypothetical protein
VTRHIWGAWIQNDSQNTALAYQPRMLQLGVKFTF